MTSKDHHEAVVAYRLAVGSGSLESTLHCAYLALAEAKYAIMLAGDADQKLLDDLQSVMVRLQAKSGS